MQDYFDVVVVPNEGKARTIRFQDDERGNELADYLKGMARREELASVDFKRQRKSAGSAPAAA